MTSRSFRNILFIRVLLLGASVFLFYTAMFRHLYAASVLIAALVVYQVFSLIRYVETTNRELTRFLESIRYGDFTAGFTTGIRGRAFDDLNRSFSEVVARFREISAEKEEGYRYLHAVVQHVGVGMIAFRDDGEVELINAAAKKLFDIPRLGNINDLTCVSPDLVETLRTIEPGGKDLKKITTGEDLLQLSVFATELRLRHTTLKLVSIQNIGSELSAREMEAWQNLIRVLTHEIKNSLAPIVSLTSSVEDMLSARERAGGVEDDATKDMHGALQTIRKRSEGLLRFTDAYRSLTRIKKPEFQRFRVAELLDRVGSLTAGQVEEAAITFIANVEPPTLELTADPQLIEQVLINLILNAIDAIEGKSEGQIEIDAFVDGRSRIMIRVTDNGRGIIGDALEKIFVPFFSTKKDGSGIGLSLSRQIMRLHHGDLTVQSTPGERTVFAMRF